MDEQAQANVGGVEIGDGGADAPATETTATMPQPEQHREQPQTESKPKSNSLDDDERFRSYKSQRDKAEAQRIAELSARYEQERVQFAQQQQWYEQAIVDISQQAMAAADPETKIALLEKQLQMERGRGQQQLQMAQQQQQQQQMRDMAVNAVGQLAQSLGIGWDEAKPMLADINPLAPDAYVKASLRLAQAAAAKLNGVKSELPKVEKRAAQNALREAGVMRTSSGGGNGGSLAALEAKVKGLAARARQGDDAAYVQWRETNDQITQIRKRATGEQ